MSGPRKRAVLHRLHSTEGSTIVECAFILPVLLLLLIGIMEGGRVLSAWVVLTNETREAARYGVAGAQDASFSTLASTVSAYAGGLMDQSLDPAYLTVNVTVTPPSGSAAGSVAVQSQYVVPMLEPLMQGVLGTVTVKAESVMRAE